MTYQPFSDEKFASGSERLLDGLRKDAERRGWKFYVKPSKDYLPDFVEGYTPDAMAITSEGGVLIEITSRRDLAQKGRLAEVAKRIAENPGWSFRVFYANPSDRTEPSILSPTLDDVQFGINEAKTLNEMGQERAAFVMGWATLEAIARLSMSQSDMTPLRALSPVQAVQILVQEGLLDDEDGRRLRHLARLRNEVIHGGLSTVISGEEVTSLIKDLELAARNFQEAA